MDDKQSLCEEKTFDRFFEKESKTLLRFLYYKFGDKNLSEDVAQDAFMKCWKKCAEIPMDKAKGFLYTVATNLSTSAKRREQVDLKYKNAFIQPKTEQETPEFILLEQEFRDKLKKAIADLPEKQRVAYLLSRVDKKTYKEIAEVMGVSVKAVEKLIHKALLKMRAKIDEL